MANTNRKRTRTSKPTKVVAQAVEPTKVVDPTKVVEPVIPELDKYMNELFIKLFDMVGLQFRPSMFIVKDWNETQTWTLAQHEEFVLFMVDLMATNEDAYNELIEDFLDKNEGTMFRAALQFTATFGWNISLNTTK